jgi:L,D-transpeptidase-like protein
MVSMPAATRVFLPRCAMVILLIASLAGCVQTAPPELLEAVESLDRDLVAIRGVEFAPTEYARFVQDWAALRGRMLAEEDVIRWPWEPNPLVADLQKVQEEGEKVMAVATQRKEEDHRDAEARLTLLERRLHVFNSRVDEMESRVVLGQRPIETELLVKQARSFMEQGLFARSLQATEQASTLIAAQTALLTTELGRYADERLVEAWRQMARRTIAWSRTNRTTAILVNKADRRLTIYQNGRAVVSHPVRLGYNGILEKRYQGDGATPEGQYRVVKKRDRGQTQFYRALLLDYPNAEDRRRFQKARRAGAIPAEAFIGGQIEIHGEDDLAISQTLGCLMLDNRRMDKLFEQVEVGTPVTIVGALKVSNPVALALADLEQSEEG